MSKKRIRDLSKELNVENKRIIDFLSRNGYESKTPASGLDEAGVALVEKHFKKPDIANQTPKKVAEAPKTDAKGTPKQRNNLRSRTLIKRRLIKAKAVNKSLQKQRLIKELVKVIKGRKLNKKTAIRSMAINQHSVKKIVRKIKGKNAI